MNVRRITKTLAVGSATVALTVVALMGASGTASAASVTGWIGPAGTTGFLHTSTIINSPELTAESKVYHSFGQSTAAGTIGVRPRLFKSGALCEAIDYQYNWYADTEMTAGTTKTCGSGSYNSHGFVAVWNASNNSFGEYVTFPSNPLNWTDPNTAQARSATISKEDQTSGVNAQGQKYGSAATASAEEQADLDLILAIGKDGDVGYVKGSELNKPAAQNPDTSKSDQAARDIALWNKEGTEKIGAFTVG